jgi:hypothetical protein
MSWYERHPNGLFSDRLFELPHFRRYQIAPLKLGKDAQHLKHRLAGDCSIETLLRRDRSTPFSSDGDRIYSAVEFEYDGCGGAI